MVTELVFGGCFPSHSVSFPILCFFFLTLLNSRGTSSGFYVKYIHFDRDKKLHDFFLSNLKIHYAVVLFQLARSKYLVSKTYIELN